MYQQLDCFKANMPASRPADYHLCFLNESIYIDFNKNDDNGIYLRRISFDGFGCCDLKQKQIPFNEKDSELFIKTYAKEKLNQEVMSFLIKKTIAINKENIWHDALMKYDLI